MTSEKGGRPPIVETPEQFGELADAYFAQCDADKVRPTVNGLCLAMGFSSRQTLLNYEDREGFLDVVKKARMRLENAWEQALSAPQVAGAIFWLKNQGWKDTQDIHHGGSVVHEVMLVGPSDHGQG
jgi:hypothetical protein